jgi:branched-chain amino acid transport system permease protein
MAIKTILKNEKIKKFAGLLWFVPLLALPLFTSNPYILNLITVAAIFACLALGLNIVVGYGGLLDLGYVAFFAIGAYTTAILYGTLHLSLVIVIPLAIILSGIFGFLLGLPTLGLRGDYLALVTLAFGEIVRIVLNNADALTNGPKGLSVDVFVNKSLLYYIALAMIVFLLYLAHRIKYSQLGLQLIAVREDEVAAKNLGLNTVRIKLFAFVSGAAFAGLTGAFFAISQGFISPESFTFWQSVMILAMVIIGGLASIGGVILGAVIVTLIPELGRLGVMFFSIDNSIANTIEQYRMLFVSGLLLLIIVLKPEGILPSRHRKAELENVR